MISEAQRKLLRIAVFGALRLDEGEYRFLLRNVAHVESSSELDNRKFEDVMAHLEGRGFHQAGRPADYWRSQADSRQRSGGSRQLHLIQELAAQCPYPLGSMVLRASSNRTELPEQLTPRESWQLVESLKSIIARKSQGDLKQKIARQFSLFPQGNPTLPDVQQPRRKPQISESSCVPAQIHRPVTADEIPF